MALTTQDIKDFFDARFVNAACPRCEGNSWSIGGEAGRDDRILLGWSAEPHIVVGRSGVDVVMIGCNNCGYVEFHLQEPIRKWKAARQSGEQ